MNRQWAVQIFSMLAIVAGAFISYFPPVHNAEAMWALIGSFLGYGIRDLFGQPAGVVPPPALGAAMPADGGQGGFARIGMLVALAGAAAVVVLIAGCATAPGAPRQTPQQIAAQVCPAVQITVANLLVLRGLSTEAHDELATAAPIVDAVCAGTQAVDLASLKRLADTALPALIKIADAAPLQPSVHDQIIMGLTVGQIVLEGALQAAGIQPGPAAGVPK